MKKNLILSRVLPTLLVSSARLFSTAASEALVQDVYIAIGSNVGDRLSSIKTALVKLQKLGEVVCTSFLYGENLI